MAIQKEILNNQLVLISEPIATVKTVAIGFWFNVGSRFEDDKTSGVSHFVEHMLFKGTSDRNAYDIACSFDRIGGYINAFTERDVTCLHATVPAKHFEYVLNILCSMVTDSTFLNEDLERERKVIESEIITSKDDPEEAAFDELYAVLWPDQRLSQPIAGTVEQVHAIKRETIFEWYQRFFANGELVVSISGLFEVNKAAEILQKMPVRQKNNHTLENLKWQKGSFCIKAPFLQNQVFTAFPLPKLNPASYQKLAVLNAIVGDTMSSRLFQRLREQNGFCYTVYSFFTVFEDTAFWCAYTSVAKKNTRIAAKELNAELRNLKDNGVTQEEIDAAKEHICGEEIISSEDVESRMKRLARLYFMNFDLCTFEEYCEQINSLQAKELNEDLSKMLDFSNQARIIYGGRFDWKKLDKYSD